MKILLVVGTRPEIIKMAQVIDALKDAPGVQCEVCITAQHREMLDQVLKLFQIVPEFDLNIMKPGQDITDITANVLYGMREIFKNNHYDWVLVHGDTTTTIAASIAAFYAKIPVGHVEAGLRTGDLQNPWPEELNRILVSHVAALHFAPTEQARENLLREGVKDSHIHVTGNTVIDALNHVVKVFETDEHLTAGIRSKYSFLDKKKKIILVTGHRRENLGRGIDRICVALKRLSQRDDVQIIFPVHLNPLVQDTVHAILDDIPNVFLVEPQEYFSFVYLMSISHIIITDSGGIQEEAPSLGKPVIVTRECTERPEAVSAGTVVLVGTDTDKIITETNKLLDDDLLYSQMAQRINPYGDGKASSRIRSIICDMKDV